MLRIVILYLLIQFLFLGVAFWSQVAWMTWATWVAVLPVREPVRFWESSFISPWRLCQADGLNLHQMRSLIFFFFGRAWSSLLRGLFSSWGEWKLLASCGAQLSHCSGFSRCVKWGFLNYRWIWLSCGVYISHNVPLPVPILCSSIVMLSH